MTYINYNMFTNYYFFYEILTKLVLAQKILFLCLYCESENHISQFVG